MGAVVVEVGIAWTGDGMTPGTWSGALARGRWAEWGWAQVQGSGKDSRRGLRWSSECEWDLEWSREGRREQGEPDGVGKGADGHGQARVTFLWAGPAVCRGQPQRHL